MPVEKNPLPNPSKRKVRPSTAPSNIQTHPSYQTGLYHNTARPVTAGFGDTSRPSLAGGLRPKTQASGPRQNWRLTKKTNEQPKLYLKINLFSFFPLLPYPVKPQQTQTGQKARRLTVGGVDG
ncbi:DgyrCDS4011 [Dimorphilus gyrociliatus]|uniref:DgyrCDS4011 n=1 Tax=Dimorphilus gyrociliatus TaxID=2664684 RepID=A0A7I8VH17_9ANNE|nr:DgyrCDS4011 [Dimorphilus gyrociliatus]